MRKILYINILEYYGDIVLALKFDSLNIVSNTMPLSVVSKPEINSESEVFENKKTKASIDEIGLSNQNNNKQIEEKSDNKKKWLISAGIALGALAIGITTACFMKKAPEFIAKKNAKIALRELDDYIAGWKEMGDDFIPQSKNPNSMFMEYYQYKKDLMANNKCPFCKPRLNICRGNSEAFTFQAKEEFLTFLEKDSKISTKKDVLAVIDEIAKDMPCYVKKHHPQLRPEFSDNADKIYKWYKILNSEFKDNKTGRIIKTKLYDEKLVNQNWNEFSSFIEQVTEKKVLIGAKSRMGTFVSDIGILNNPNAYKDVDYILFGHGKGSSLITDATQNGTWVFSDTGESVWEFIEKQKLPKGSKILVETCEVDGLERKVREGLKCMFDKNGKYKFGIGNTVSAAHNEANPAKIVEVGKREIIGHKYIKPEGMDDINDFIYSAIGDVETVYYAL